MFDFVLDDLLLLVFLSSLFDLSLWFLLLLLELLFDGIVVPIFFDFFTPIDDDSDFLIGEIIFFDDFFFIPEDSVDSFETLDSLGGMFFDGIDTVFFIPPIPLPVVELELEVEVTCGVVGRALVEVEVEAVEDDFIGTAAAVFGTDVVALSAADGDM